MVKWIWRLLGFVAVLIVVAVGGLFLLPKDRLGAVVSDQLTSQLGRDVSLGAVSVSVWPVLGVDARDVRIANADWAGDQPMFTAQRAAFGVDPVDALQGRLTFRSIEAEAPQVRLQQNADGQANWQLGGTSGDGEPGALPVVTLDRLQITGGTLSIDTPGQSLTLRDADLTLRWPNRAGPAQLTARVTPYDGPLAIDATISNPRTLMAGGAVPVELTLSTPGGEIRFSGPAGTAPEAQGTLTLDLSNTTSAAAALGQPGLALPAGLGQTLAGSAQITYTRDAQLALREAALTSGSNTLALNADITLSGKPFVNAVLQTDALDLSGLSSSDTPSTQGWSTTPIDASALSSINGTIALLTDALTLGPLSFTTTRALLTIDNARAVFDLRQLSGYDGTLSGEFVLNNRSGLSVGGDLAFGGIELQPLLTDAIGIERLSGPTDGRLQFLGSGQSMAAIMASLSGDGLLRAGPGVIAGLDLDQILAGSSQSGTTIFDQATASFTIAKGVLRNDDLLLRLPRIQASGEGRIDLGQRSLDYLLTPFSTTARGGQGLAVPVRIKGPWSGPGITIDAAEALNQNFAREREALETEARDRVNTAISDRLGVTVEEGQSVEDALQQKLADEAQKGLQNLLNR